MNTALAQEPRTTHKLLEKALSAGQNRPDRLPGLQIVANQLPRVLEEEIVNLSSLELKIRHVDTQASTVADACALPPGALAGIVRAERWRNWVFFVTDPIATALFVESATGCNGLSSDGLPVRTPTKTDRNIVRVIFRRVARSLTTAFSSLVDVSFDVGDVIERLEFEQQPKLSPSTPVIALKLSIENGGNTGLLSIVIPHPAIETVRDVLASAAPAEAAAFGSAGPKSREATGWAKQLADEVARAALTVNGVLEERTIPLGEVSKFAVGTVVELQGNSVSRIRLDADEAPLFWCELGRRDGGLILRLEEDFDRHRDGIDEFYGL